MSDVTPKEGIARPTERKGGVGKGERDAQPGSLELFSGAGGENSVTGDPDEDESLSLT